MMGRGRTWWAMVALNAFFLLAGQTAATLLGRAYYDNGGNSIWMATLVQTAGFPLLLLARFFIPSSTHSSSSSPPPPPLTRLAAVYLLIGLLIAADNLMYSYGLLFLPVSTFSLLCATQLAFNAVLSRLLNSQRFTILILNTVFVLSAAAALLGLRRSPASPSPRFAAGFSLTLAASAAYALVLCLMQLAFLRLVRQESFGAVVDMQVSTAAVAAAASAAGLFAAGEWRSIAGEAAAYRGGGAGYVATLAGTAAAWQMASVGVVGLVFLVSSLFSNVVSVAALPLVPVFAAAFFGDAMDGEKILALLLAVWASVSYVYQHYLDDASLKPPPGAADQEAPPPPSS
ncbi:putative purine permease 11 [Wolffia australiana]